MTTLKDRTASYNAILDCKGSLISAVSDMSIHESISYQEPNEMFGTIVFDGNLSIETMNTIVKSSKKSKIIFEPVSNEKSIKVFDVNGVLEGMNRITYITPNSYELESMFNHFKDKKDIEVTTFEQLQDSKMQVMYLLTVFPNILLKKGKDGSCLYKVTDAETVDSIHQTVTINRKEHTFFYNYISVEPNSIDIFDVTGAGDTLVGSFASGIDKCDSVFSCKIALENATRNAERSLMVNHAVSKDLIICLQ